MKERRYDLDWLRVIAMLAVFIFHCSRFFDTEGWHVKNSRQSEVLFVLMRGLFWPWMMELFFLLSGAGTWYALKSRTAGAYLFERVKRLLIPLYAMGLFVLLPPQFYFEIVTNEGFSGTFREMIPRYFAEFYPPRITPWPETLLPVPFCGHLWFLQHLFLISVITLPLLLYLNSQPARRWINRLAGLCDRRGGIFIFVIPLALAMIGLRGLFEGQGRWADFLWYAIYFVIGYVMVADKRFTDSVKRHGWVCLAPWLIGFFGGMSLLILVFGYDPSAGHENSLLIYVAAQIVWSSASWSAVVFVLSLGARYLNFNHNILAYGNEAVLPFYLFHQTIILIVGFFVVRWDIVILLKLPIIAVLSLPLILVLYELTVKPFNAMRFFFGMRPRKQLKK
ncbi:MAG: acyltransferase family protein [Planctomycetota bacterium]|jgi:surface polysaccharide O-acyltransferase-like enzyme